ncbi:hypothetical protein LC593_36440 [Nostoc sp. CHAB 5844]|nr:hypothetical protein [Nostoc sp. CHAB 5844]
MIDAATFASLFNAFWRSAAPTCELFVRDVNIGKISRFDIPLAGKHSPLVAPFIAETGFSRFALMASQPELASDSDRLYELALRQAEKRLRGYQDADANPPTLTASDKSDAIAISDRLAIFFRHPTKPIVLRPLFSGCGFVDNSEGDIRWGSTLFEVKSVERTFRSVDIYQLFTYYSLSVSEGNSDIDSVGIVNPKRGVSFEIDIEDLSREISGLSASNLADVVIRAISSGDISR